ncbi:hypothetical protein ACFLSA_06210 [Bacteroidota bacterium]
MKTNKHTARYHYGFFGLIFTSTFLLFLVSGCSQNKNLLPPHEWEYLTVTLKKGDLQVSIKNNEHLYNPFRKRDLLGLNGIIDLSHPAERVSPISHTCINLEHIFAGDRLLDLFEPRTHYMSLLKGKDDEWQLYQSPTPISQVETLTSFKLTAPHYIDIKVKCMIHSDDFITHDYLGLFFASYIEAPEDKRIFFQGYEKGETTPKWIEAYSEKHGDKSTHIAKDDDKDAFYFAPDFNVKLANHFSEYKYDKPFYYGRFKNMVLAFLFDSSEIIRFSQSPTGGGAKNPAWDFQYIIPNPQLKKEYSFRARIVYKPFISEEDVLKEYQDWKETLNIGLTKFKRMIPKDKYI